MKVSFSVRGTPKPAGSKRGFATKGGRVVMVDASGQAGKDNRHDIRCTAQDAMAGTEPTRHAVTVSVTFFFDRPKSHYRSGARSAELRPDAPTSHARTPDIDKLCRQVLDGMTGIVFVDDSQVTSIHAKKRYGAAATMVDVWSNDARGT